MSKALALQRMQRTAPSTYNKVMKLIEEHQCLWNLAAEHFDQLVGTTLRQLVKEDICRRPLSMDELKARKVLKL